MRPSDVLKNEGGLGTPADDTDLDSSRHSSVSPAAPTEERYGLAKYAKKGEDCAVAREHNGQQLYGVFDGHGGERLASELSTWLPKALAGADEMATINTYYRADMLLGAKYLTEGSTATCAVVTSANDRAVVSISWVGDSKLICLDMLHQGKALVFETGIHHVTNPAEIARLERHWAARKQQPTADEPDIISRGREYERRVEANHATCGSPYVREQSIVGRRVSAKGNVFGPLVVQALWTSTADDEPIRGASTCVTRAIGDWDSSRALVPHPDVVVHHLEGTVWRRYIAASDGLWDIVTSDKARKVAAEYEYPQHAAEALLRRAKRGYAARKGADPHPFGDDTTILVFDVKLGDPPFLKSKRSFSNLSGLCKPSPTAMRDATALPVKLPAPSSSEKVRHPKSYIPPISPSHSAPPRCTYPRKPAVPPNGSDGLKHVTPVSSLEEAEVQV